VRYRTTSGCVSQAVATTAPHCSFWTSQLPSVLMASMTLAPTPLFIHVHLPRSAGTSLNSLLEQWFEDHFLHWYDPDPNRIYSIEEIEQKVLSVSKLRCVASHSIRTYPPSICGRPTHYITFLRDPIDRIISDCTYTQKHYGDFSPEHKRALPREFGELNLVGMLAYWLRRAESLERTGTWSEIPLVTFTRQHS
jgi:hypothetical protein